MIVFVMAYSNHPDKEKEITKVWGVSIKLKHNLITTAMLFLGVLVFGVNNHTELFLGITVHHLHLLFTGLAISSGYVMIMTYPDTDKGHNLSIGGLVFGGFGFLLGYILHLYSIAWGEVLAAIPFAVFFGLTWIFKK